MIAVVFTAAFGINVVKMLVEHRSGFADNCVATGGQVIQTRDGYDCEQITDKPKRVYE